MQSSQTPVALRSAVLLHTFLLAGVLGVQAVIAALFWLEVAPLSPETSPVPFVCAGVGVALLVGGLVYRTRVPQPTHSITIESHWTQPTTMSAASMVWFLMEGGAIISAVGFLLSGETAPGIVSAVAFVAILLSGPRRWCPSTRDGSNRKVSVIRIME